MKICYIMRGLPGSGKTYLANDLAGPHGRIISNNDFMVDDRGAYCYDRSRQKRVREQCFAEFAAALAAGVEIVIVDNCNMVIRSYENFVQLALRLGYRVRIVPMPYRKIERLYARSIHMVPWDMYKTMADSWEHDPRLWIDP